MLKRKRPSRGKPKSTIVRVGKRFASKRPYFEEALKGVAEVVDPLMKKHPFFKGVWIFGSVPDKVHKDLDILIVMDLQNYSFPGNIRTHLAEQIKKKLGLKGVDWLTIDTAVLEKDLWHIRNTMELWKPDITCFYGDPLTRRHLKNALGKTRTATGYYKKYDKAVLRALKQSRKNKKS